jgi:NitT/TauT family transport system permease protein
MKRLWTVIVALGGSVIIGLLQQEAWGWCASLAKGLVRVAARLVPPGHRDRYREEWLAELEELQGRNLAMVALSMVALAWRILRCAPRTRLALRQRGVRADAVGVVDTRLPQVIAPLITVIAMIAMWYGVSYLLLDANRRFLVPPLHDVIRVAFLDPYNLHELLAALWLSTRVAFAGLGGAITVGVGLAVLMSQSRWIRWSLYPIAVMISTIPVLAMVPMFTFWFGYTFTSRTFVVILFAIFPIVTNTLFGLKLVPPEYDELLALQGGSRLSRLRKLQLPAALPAIFTGIRASAGLTVIGAIVGDFFFQQGNPGIGMLIADYQARLQSEQMIAAVMLSSLLGLLVFWLFGFVTRRVVGGWHESGVSPGS